MIKINNYQDLLNSKNKIPALVYTDVQKRIGDWLSYGNSLEDDYVKNQFRYVERVLNR